MPDERSMREREREGARQTPRGSLTYAPRAILPILLSLLLLLRLLLLLLRTGRAGDTRERGAEETNDGTCCAVMRLAISANVTRRAK